ncbi:hypothetical protein MVEN_00874100 [Mycena venus]|uniref:Uncharacterized protein n=1 Tax=Mycena venus TaxID=2733690 RepID=A0A8H6YGR2_9AGAR|nr:hypothetical protein MVEN_00874100 [Mycena venus]
MSTPRVKASTSASVPHPAVAEDRHRRSQNPPVTDFWKHVRRIVAATGEHKWSNVLALANNESRGKMSINTIKSRLIQHQANLVVPTACGGRSRSKNLVAEGLASEAAVPPALVALHLGLRTAVALACMDSPMDYLHEVYLDDTERLDVPANTPSSITPLQVSNLKVPAPPENVRPETPVTQPLPPAGDGSALLAELSKSCHRSSTSHRERDHSPAKAAAGGVEPPKKKKKRKADASEKTDVPPPTPKPTGSHAGGGAGDSHVATGASKVKGKNKVESSPAVGREGASPAVGKGSANPAKSSSRRHLLPHQLPRAARPKPVHLARSLLPSFRTIPRMNRITDRVIHRIGQMNIDDEGGPQKASQGSKSNKRSAATKEGGHAASRPPKEPKGKRARVDSNPQFHKDSFLTAGKSTTEFYAMSAHVNSMVDEADSVASMPSDFMDNHLAMRKRMYFIMVEMATIHEQLRSILTRRSQLVDEGGIITDRLRSF